jgi:hypothetical protein
MGETRGIEEWNRDGAVPRRSLRPSPLGLLLPVEQMAKQRPGFCVA